MPKDYDPRDQMADGAQADEDFASQAKLADEELGPPPDMDTLAEDLAVKLPEPRQLGFFKRLLIREAEEKLAELSEIPDENEPLEELDVQGDGSSDFKPTDGQAKALELGFSLADSNEDKPHGKLGVVAGFAGTGKTTMLRELLRRVGRCVLLAPTGKAALRMTEATGIPAQTIHSWLYTPFEDPKTGRVLFERRGPADIAWTRNRLVVIDEASMIQRDVWADIVKALRMMRLNVLLVGDPFQLPPVESWAETQASGGVPFSIFTLNYPDMAGRIDLTEIMRQALDSPIIRASLALRQGDLWKFRHELAAATPAQAKAAIEEAIVGKAGTVICHTNAYRHGLNAQIRKLLGRGGSVEPGEPLLVMRNSRELGYMNGEVIPFRGWAAVSKPLKVYHEVDGQTRAVETQFAVARLGEMGRQLALVPTARLFGLGAEIPIPSYLKAKGRLDWPVEELRGKAPNGGWLKPGDLPLLDCNLGYVLTAHKSQGSQWPKVVVIIERSVRPRQLEGRRWLYTATTRAIDTATVYWKG